MAKSSTSATAPAAAPGVVEGVLAEFADPGALLHAAEKVRDAGFKKWDVYSPFPVHGMDDAMGLKPSILGTLAFIVALCGGLFALFFQWWTSVYGYALVIGGKPLASWPAFIPITFEFTVLCAMFTTVFGMFMLNKLPRYHHPVWYSDNFLRATDDGFFVVIDAIDDKFDAAKTIKFLEQIGGANVELLKSND